MVMSLTSPVALFIFNRPDLTRIAFGAIAQVRPRKLLVVADGPRSPEEAEKCREARAVIERVDWPCKVLTNFAETNMKCGIRVASGLDWVFSEADEAIIIEDDCLPDPSFFTFAQQLLDHYRDDERVMHINGSNFISDSFSSEHSYYFSRYPFSSGWASWSRAWRHFDRNIESWPKFKRLGMLEQVFETRAEQDFWRGVLDRMHAGAPTVWDFMWNYACWSQGGLSIVPRVNLVSNLGFRPDATHTNTPYERDWLSNVPRGSIDEIQHPDFVVRNREADNQIARAYYGCGEEKQDFKLPTGLQYYWAALKYKLGQLRSSS
jgi:hypothetical protein